jgi:hypothetical protein
VKISESGEWVNREGLEEYAVRWNWVNSPSSSGFTAVLRVKDEARSLPWVLPGVLRSVEKAIVVDNGSTDGTPEVAREVAGGLGMGEKLEVLSYPFRVSRCGPEHLMTYPDSVHSLTYFYNWSFSHVSTLYALKWDGDMVLTPEGEGVLRDLAWQLEGADGRIGMGRFPVYVESDRVAYVDLAPIRPEVWGWRNTPERTFFKAFDWEHVHPHTDLPVELPHWVCFELKWLDADEFSHWSHTNFKAVINKRKRREWDLFHTLREGSPLPEEVARVESPEGLHVVEHLRRTHTAMLRRFVPVDLDENVDKSWPRTDGVGGEPAPLHARGAASVGQPTQNGRRSGE